LTACYVSFPRLVPSIRTIRVHDPRHTHATCMIAAGHPVKAVSRRPGHADITIALKTYAHVMPNDDGKLATGAEILFG
jgi:integrase